MKKRLLNQKSVAQWLYSVGLLLLCVNASWGQQVIGSYPNMNGGFEGPDTGLTFTNNNMSAATTTWTKNSNTAATITKETTTPRTGVNYVKMVQTGTSTRRIQSPTSVMRTEDVGKFFRVQFYYKGDLDGTPTGSTIEASATVQPGIRNSILLTSENRIGWFLYEGIIATQNANNSLLYATLNVTNTATFEFDDFAIYPVSLSTDPADGTAPSAATAAVTPVSGTTVSWLAPGTGVDGGGYMVVRYATNPNIDQDPNVKGIYAKGLTITNGTNGVSNPGTVVYIGTGTSFTDDVAGSSSGTDYYKIYTVDKAFNYAAELIATAVVSSTPAITCSTETLIGLNYAGVGPSTSQSFLVSGSNLTSNLVVSTASTDFELSTDNFATAGVSSISLSGTTVASTTISVRLKANLIGGSKSATVTIASTGANTLPTLSLSGSATNVFYYNGSGALSSNTSWGANSNGTGANPTAVTDTYTNFVIANGNPTTNASWTLGSNSKVIVGNGSAVTLTVANGFPITGTIDAAANGSVVWQDVLASPTFGTLNNDSEVHYQPAATASYGLGNGTAYGKLFIDGAGKVNVLPGTTVSTATVKNAFTVASGSTLDFPITNTHSITINTGASATINGTVMGGKQGGFFGTAAGGATTTSVSILFEDAKPNFTLGASSTINYSRPNGAQTVSALPLNISNVQIKYANLTLSETGSTTTASKTIAGAITVNGTLTTNMVGFSSTITGGGNITMASGSTFVRTSKTLDVAPTFLGAINVTYNGTGATQMLGTTVLGSPNVTLTLSNSAIAVGNTVTGTGVPAGTTVASIAGTALVLSQNATASTATSPSIVYVSLTIGTAVPQTTGVELPTAASNALNNLTFDNAAGVTLGAATTATNIITNKSNALTLGTANYLNANLQMNGAAELTLNVNANQANLKKIVFSSATTAKLKLNMSTDIQIAFTNSSTENWGTGTVQITGFQEGKIKFGSSNTALTATQLGLIKDTADLSKTFKLSDQGYLYYSTTIIPGDAFVVTSANPVFLATGVASTYSITTTTPNTPTSFALADATNSPLPAGLTLNATTGAIEGTPTAEVTSLVVPITLTNSVNSQAINFTFNVRTRDPQTITWSQDFPATNTYGDGTIALTATTDAPALSVSYSSSNTAVATISGSTLTIVGPGTTTITASQAGNPDYAPATNLTKELVVNAKSLTIAGAAAVGKVYNQSTAATITGTLAGGLVGSDVVTLVLSGTYADANAGVDKPVTSTSTLTGAAAAKYSLTQPTGLTATITKADQLLTAMGTSSFKIIGDADYDPVPLVTDSNITGVASVAIENPNFTYTSSNESVATIVNGKVHIVGLGTTTITGQQAGSLNYNVSLPVSQTLKVLPVPLVAWDLYNFNPTGDQQSVTSVNASQVAAGISVTPSLSMGNMAIITNAGNRYRFTSSDWPYATSSGTVAPIDIATGKYMSVAIAADSENSLSLSSINASFRGGAISSELLSQFAYSTDGVTFTAIGSPTTFAGASGTRFYSDIDLSGIAALQNLPSGTTVTLRYYASGKSNGTGSTVGQKAWGFFSDFVENNTRALIIGGTVTRTSTTWNGTAWSNGTPTATVEAIIAGNYSTTANGAITARKLTVNSGVLTVNSGNLTVQDELINNSSATAVVFENNTNLIQGSATIENANSGAITVKRNSASIQLFDYTLWSSPVASQELQAFSPNTVATRFYTYNSTTNLYNTVSPTTNFATATGYLIRAPNTWTAATPNTFNGVFTGKPNNGNISVGGLISGKYYAVGNPYPSTINVAAFYNVNPNAGTLYFWRKTNGASGTAYATRNNTGATASGGYTPSTDIAVGQGFFVSPSADMTLNFTNAMRANPSTSATFLRITEERSHFWLNLTNTSGLFSQMLVGYLPEATSGIDNAIDGKYINDAPIALTSIINDEEYTIQGRALPIASTDTVPLGFKTNAAGDYTIAIDHVDGLFSTEQAIYLKDNLLNTVNNLSVGSYSFASEIGTFNSRFEVVYQNTLAVTNPTFTANSVITYCANGEISISSGSTIIELVRVYDLQGRLLVEKKQINASETKLSTTATNQVLLVEITATNGSKITKKIIQ